MVSEAIVRSGSFAKPTICASSCLSWGTSEIAKPSTAQFFTTIARSMILPAVDQAARLVLAALMLGDARVVAAVVATLLVGLAVAMAAGMKVVERIVWHLKSRTAVGNSQYAPSDLKQAADEARRSVAHA